MSAVNLICFPGAPNLPLFAALAHGDFTRAGLEVAMETTPSSTHQIEQVAAGRFQIAATAFDNVVAYRDGRGAVSFDHGIDLVAFMGATRIELSLIVAPEIETYADLRGRSLAVDALATGFAFVLYDMLEKAGLSLADCELATVGATPKRWASVESGEHAGTLTIEPFTSIAAAKGFRVLARSVDTVPAYQGGVFAASRAWAEANSGAVIGFVRGYLAGLGWTLARANYAAAKDLLLANMPAIAPGVADTVMAKLLDPATGLTPGGAFDTAGIETVLELRRRYSGAAEARSASRYVDSSYLEQALDLARDAPTTSTQER